MLYKFYVLSSLVAVITFATAQYQGWSLFSEDENESQVSNHHSSGGGSFGSGSHRGTFHK